MRLVITIVMFLCVLINAQTKLQTETTFQNDELAQGVSVQRLQLNSSMINVKYDYKVDLANKKTIDDVFGVFSPSMNIGNKTSISFGIVKLGDWKENDEVLFDGKITKTFSDFLFSINLGHGEKINLGSRDYAISTFESELLTVEAGFVSQYNYSDFFQLTKNKYYWASFHPDYLFVAIGNEIEKSWLIFGTKDMEDFGNFTFLNVDRSNKNFWLRTQFGYRNINKYFYSLENYRVATSYLVVPPFFYKHFSPVATKGDYALKVDGKKVGNVEIWEIVGAKNFGDFGRITLGWQKESSNKGVVAEYYKELLLGNFSLISELRYESLFSRFSGFITTSYNF